MMITTVTLNAALDITYTVSNFYVDHLHRTHEYLSVPGGKGVNVARVVHALGEGVTTTGFVAGYNGAAILSGLKEESIPTDFLTLAHGESRRAITILDPTQGTHTELIEVGPPITQIDLQRLRHKIEQLAKSSSCIVLSGSIPSGCPSWIYAELTEIAHHQGAKVALDASGEALREGLHGRPDLVKLNEHELAELLGIAPGNDLSTLQAMSSFIKEGTPFVVVSQGERGALAVSADYQYRIHIPQVEAVNPVGSGDAMMAGLVSALYRGSDIQDVLLLGAACGTANTLNKMAGKVTLEDIAMIQQGIEITLIKG
ncbi:tagatose 6-phosphate kinase [Paenibacillus sp. DS2015]|uniref:1-phosphofructokinase family hexose kinase n=1 Tax=Paenibacillus sp. DS2015 TaxID=3373917 RepID=UPI003D19AAED